MSDIRKCFTSRFKHGKLVEVDFSQLEVAALAFLSNDSTMKNDIRDKLDMHLVSASWVTGTDYDTLKHHYDNGDPSTIKLRKEAKRPRFELQYGAGAATIAKNNKWPLSKAKDYIARYFARYPEVKAWQERVAEEVERNKKPKASWVMGVEEYISYYRCPHTQRRYVFSTYPNKRGEPSFSPTQLKNYPVQGFATGDLVPTILGSLVQYLYGENLQDRVLLVNTVHDSVLLDVDMYNDSTINDCFKAIHATFGKAHDIMQDVFGIDIDVPIRYSISTGDNWADMSSIGEW